jgi:hypothetical protein
VACPPSPHTHTKEKRERERKPPYVLFRKGKDLLGHLVQSILVEKGKEYLQLSKFSKRYIFVCLTPKILDPNPT